MVARPEVGEDDAARRLLRDRGRGEYVVDAPADVPLAQVAPRRPPREESRVVRIERPADVDQAGTEKRREQLALLGALADDLRLALARVHVQLAARDVDVAAEHEVAPVLAQLARPRDEAAHELELGGVV